MIRKKRLSALLTALILSAFLCLQAQPDYWAMKESMNDKSLPLVNITVDINEVNSEYYVGASVAIADVQRRTDADSLEVNYSCKVKYRGHSSLVYDKKSFAVKLLDEKGQDLDASLLGIRYDNNWILNAMAIDRIRMRDRVNFDAWNEFSTVPYETVYQKRNGTEGCFVEVFVNGKYHGLYCLTDKINRKLLGLKKSKADSNGRVNVKGLLYKCSTWETGAKLDRYVAESMNQSVWSAWELKYPDEYPCEATFGPLRDLIVYCNSTNDAQFERDFDKHFYLQNMVDYRVFHLALGLRDNHLKNTYLSARDISTDQRILITPWDLDTSLGGDWDGGYKEDVAEWWLMNEVKPYQRLWNGDVFDFRRRVAQRWYDSSVAGPLSVGRFNERLDAYAKAFVESGAWEREYAKWNGKPVELKKDIYDELKYVKDWYVRNYENLRYNVFDGFYTDGVINMPAQSDTSTAAYNLKGQSAGTNHRGIVITNGKKIWRR